MANEEIKLREVSPDKEPGDPKPEIFKEENKSSEFFEKLNVVKTRDRIFLMNVGRPARITVNNQRVVKWRDARGRTFRLEIIMHRPFGDNKQAEDLKIPIDKKELIYFNSDNRVDGRRQIDVGYTFDVFDYPHIINFPIGNNRFDERLYTFKCGVFNPETSEMESEPLPVLVENREDADVLLKNFEYLEPCTEGGKSLRESNYRKSYGKRSTPVEGSVRWGEFQDVDKTPSKMPREEQVNKKQMPRSSDIDEE